MTVPVTSPLLPPFRCDQHVAWPVGDMQHVVLDIGPHGGEVLHIGPGFEKPQGLYTHQGIAEALAEVLATRLTQKAAA